MVIFKRAAQLTGLVILLCSLPLQNLFAQTYPLPLDDDNTIIGDVGYVSAIRGETLVNVAEQYDLGLNAVINANPQFSVTDTLSSGTYIKIPQKHILPPMRQEGIIINLPEMRLYYYPEDSDEVKTYPIGIGRIGKTIPVINTAIAKKVTNPVWIPPADIRKFNADQGIQLPAVMPAGPDNPLGPYAIYLRLPTYLIHSTIFPESIGRRASFGCIRMNETDIKDFFPVVTAGIPVAIIDMPVKVGWDDEHIYLEAHPPLEEHNNHPPRAGVDPVIKLIEKNTRHRLTMVDWQLVSYLADNPDGVPYEIGFEVQ